MVLSFVIDADERVEHHVGEHPRGVHGRINGIEELQFRIQRRPQHGAFGASMCRTEKKERQSQETETMHDRGSLRARGQGRRRPAHRV